MFFQKKFLAILIFLFCIFINCNVFADEPIIYSPAAILIDSNSGNILYEKNSNNLMYPASTTKIMTAIIALENCSLDEQITASQNAITSVKSGYTNANIQPYETLTMEQLLYALMLNSANEAANVIGEHIGGTIENFANIMNAKAIELGCRSTHFVNANGIHDDAHYTTALDLANITRYCMKNETFRKIVSTLQYPLPATEAYPNEDRILKNTNGLMLTSHKYYYPYAIGIKTGFTTQAKNCLVSASYKDGLELISVVLHAESTDDGRSARYLDTINLLEYGNNSYHSYTVLEKDAEVETVNIQNVNKELSVIAKDNIIITIPNGSEPNITSKDISINENLSAPIESGNIIGNITYVINGINYSSDLLAASGIPLEESIQSEEPVSDFHFKYILWIFLILLLFRIMLYFLQKYFAKRSKIFKKRTKKYLHS